MQETQLLRDSDDARHDTARTPLWMVAAMGVTRYVLPSLSVRALGIVERLLISSLLLVHIAFLTIRHPSLFTHPLLEACLRLSGLFATSHFLITTLAVVFIGYLATGVVLPGASSRTRWNIPHTLIVMVFVLGGASISSLLFIPGVLLPVPWAYALIVAGLFLGSWLPAQFGRPANTSAVAANDVSRWPTWREASRSLVLILFFAAL